MTIRKIQSWFLLSACLVADLTLWIRLLTAWSEQEPIVSFLLGVQCAVALLGTVVAGAYAVRVMARTGDRALLILVIIAGVDVLALPAYGVIASAPSYETGYARIISRFGTLAMSPGHYAAEVCFLSGLLAAPLMAIGVVGWWRWRRTAASSSLLLFLRWAVVLAIPLGMIVLTLTWGSEQVRRLGSRINFGAAHPGLKAAADAILADPEPLVFRESSQPFPRIIKVRSRVLFAGSPPSDTWLVHVRDKRGLSDPEGGIVLRPGLCELAPGWYEAGARVCFPELRGGHPSDAIWMMGGHAPKPEAHLHHEGRSSP